MELVQAACGELSGGRCHSSRGPLVKPWAAELSLTGFFSLNECLPICCFDLFQARAFRSGWAGIKALPKLTADPGQLGGIEMVFNGESAFRIKTDPLPNIVGEDATDVEDTARVFHFPSHEHVIPRSGVSEYQDRRLSQGRE